MLFAVYPRDRPPTAWRQLLRGGACFPCGSGPPECAFDCHSSSSWLVTLRSADTWFGCAIRRPAPGAPSRPSESRLVACSAAHSPRPVQESASHASSTSPQSHAWPQAVLCRSEASPSGEHGSELWSIACLLAYLLHQTSYVSWRRSILKQHQRQTFLHLKCYRSFKA